MSKPPRLTLYYREGCHLCEDMHQQLGELLDSDSYELVLIDIDENPVLRERYNIRVPVLSCNEHEVCEHFLDFQALQDALSSAASGYNKVS